MATQDRQGVSSTLGTRSSLDRRRFNCGELGHVRKKYPHPHMIDLVQQLSNVVPISGGNNNRGR